MQVQTPLRVDVRLEFHVCRSVELRGPAGGTLSQCTYVFDQEPPAQRAERANKLRATNRANEIGLDRECFHYCVRLKTLQDFPETYASFRYLQRPERETRLRAVNFMPPYPLV